MRQASSFFSLSITSLSWKDIIITEINVSVKLLVKYSVILKWSPRKITEGLFRVETTMRYDNVKNIYTLTGGPHMMRP